MRRMISAVRGPRPAVRVFVINVAAFTLLRAIFFLLFADHRPPTPDLLHAFYLGLKFDARLAAMVSFPLLFFTSRVYIALVEILLAIVYAADFATYAYIRQRLNAGVLEFLRNPIISLHMAWESYHVVLFGLIVVGILILIVWLFRGPRTAVRGPRWERALLAVFFLACIYEIGRAHV